MESKKVYEANMSRIDELMKKGENNLTKREAGEIRKLALEAQQHEKAVYKMKG